MTAPEFFMPQLPKWLAEEAAASDESAYEALAMLAGCRPLPLGRRIYSITWTHNGEDCTAKVGSRIETRRPASGRRGASSETYRYVVLAIYAVSDSERALVTERDPRMKWHDDWDNPLRYLHPTSETLFSHSEATGEEAEPEAAVSE